jgi:5'-deoxynucleotidase YfbR-like HD superfamily hydrolase
VGPQPETALNTRSGKVLDFADPDPAAISLEDIAWGLAHVCRFGAQANRFYSVAQHAITVARTVELEGRPDLALHALHHDSHEAFSCDIPAPLKRLLDPGYSQITDRLDAAIGEALSIGLEDPGRVAVVKAADKAAFALEADELLPGRFGQHGDVAATSIDAARRAATTPFRAWGFEEAERRFLDEHGRLLA